MPGGGGEKTEKASPKKRQDERKKGNVFMSKDVVTVVSLIASFYIIRIFISDFMTQIQINYRNQLTRAAFLRTITTGDIINMFMEFARIVATTVLPAILLIALVSIVVTGVQTRFLFTRESMKFKMSRINPLQGIKKLFALKSIVELLKSIIKIAIVIAILYNRVFAIIYSLPSIMDFEVMQAAVFAGDTIMSLLISVGIAFIAVAAVDFVYQRWDFEKNIKMTKQEVKDEYKQAEGNPEIKGKRRQKQREFAEMRMMQNVAEADVVVRNPTHYAVALRYRLDEDNAPIVLAKGVDFLAAKIVEEAERNGVPTVENPPLARGLYAAADIEEPIPAEFFQPVAELLAWIFTERKKHPKPLVKPQPRPEPDPISQSIGV